MKFNRRAVIAIIILVCTALVGYAFMHKSSPFPTKDSRTVYDGYVDIEPIDTDDLIEKLEKQGCHAFDVESAVYQGCRYQRTIDPPPGKEGIEIFPHGLGFGPVSFIVTETRLWAWQDIPGPPNEEKFKTAVRDNVRAVGNIISLHETSWKIFDIDYPTDYVY